MASLHIIVSQESITAPDWARYTAVLDSYDGAPDAAGPDNLIGTGATPQAAAADLLETLDEWYDIRPT